jgi:signal transduction histidine kinase
VRWVGVSRSRGSPGWRGLLTHPWAIDIAIAVALCVVSLLLAHQAPPVGWHHRDAVGYTLTCVINLLLFARRRMPVTVLLAGSALWTVYIAAGYWPVVNSLALLTALYTVAAQCTLRTMWFSAALGSAIWVFAGVSGQAGSVWSALAQAVVIPPIICWFGRVAHQLSESNAELRRNQRERTRRAIVDERIRLARELHDVVAHHLAVISVQAGLAHYVVDSDAATARRSLSTVLEVSAEALGELRRILDLLRVAPDDSGDLVLVDAEADSGTAVLDRLDELVERTRAAGVPIALLIEGDKRALPPGVERCVYRVVQEALTNVIKHAGSAATTVAVAYCADTISARISDQGKAGIVSPQKDKEKDKAKQPGEGGHGLVGMRERARLYGGTLTAGPLPGSGFEVVLTLPVRPPADRSEAELA